MSKHKSKFEELLETDPIFKTFLSLAKGRAKIKVVLANGKEIEGYLYSIDVFYRAFKIETENSKIIINWRHIAYIEYWG